MEAHRDAAPKRSKGTARAPRHAGPFVFQAHRIGRVLPPRMAKRKATQANGVDIALLVLSHLRMLYPSPPDQGVRNPITTVHRTRGRAVDKPVGI